MAPRSQRRRQRSPAVLLESAASTRSTTGTTWRSAAYQRFWEPHTHTDPQVRPLWETLQRREIRVGVLSNTIWSRAYHREVFERDGRARPARRRRLLPETTS